jgi:hypothetical protein
MTKSLISPKRAEGKSGRIIISAEEKATSANPELVLFSL